MERIRRIDALISGLEEKTRLLLEAEDRRLEGRQLYVQWMRPAPLPEPPDPGLAPVVQLLAREHQPDSQEAQFAPGRTAGRTARQAG